MCWCINPKARSHHFPACMYTSQIGTANLQLFEIASTHPMDFNSVESWDVITACRMASDLFSTWQCRANWESVCWQCRSYLALLASMRLCWVMLWILFVAEAPTEIQTFVFSKSVQFYPSRSISSYVIYIIYTTPFIGRLSKLFDQAHSSKKTSHQKIISYTGMKLLLQSYSCAEQTSNWRSVLMRNCTDHVLPRALVQVTVEKTMLHRSCIAVILLDL